MNLLPPLTPLSASLSPGPAAPHVLSTIASDFTDTQVTIFWVVPSIAYTPETYVVLYGTDRDSLDSTSAERSRGPDISVEQLSISLPLTGLPTTTESGPPTLTTPLSMKLASSTPPPDVSLAGHVTIM